MTDEPPQNLEVELRVIGSMLRDNRVILEVANLIRADDFFRDAHQILFRAIVEMEAAGKPVEGLSLADELRRRGEFSKAGGDDTIYKALENTPHAADALYYANIVREKSIARDAAEAATDTLKDVASGRFTCDEITQRMERRLFTIGQRTSRTEPKRYDRGSVDAMEAFSRQAANPGANGLITGLLDLDVKLGGLQPKDMVVVAARPSIGKTALALTIADFVASDLGVGTLFISLEMNQTDIFKRLMKIRSGVKLSTPPKDEEVGKMGRYMPDSTVPLWVDDPIRLTSSELSSIARRFKRREDIGLFIVDYLQLIHADDERAPRHEQVASISRKLKEIAREINATVLVLSQLNRKTEDRADSKPKLSDLRESGQIEQDADIVILLHRPDYYESHIQPGEAELNVAKNRNGATGTVITMFEKPLMRFFDYQSVPPEAFDSPPAF